MPDKRPLPPNRLETQARVCAQAVVDTLSESLLSGKPADRCLKNTFTSTVSSAPATSI